MVLGSLLGLGKTHARPPCKQVGPGPVSTLAVHAWLLPLKGVMTFIVHGPSAHTASGWACTNHSRTILVIISLDITRIRNNVGIIGQLYRNSDSFATCHVRFG